MSTPDRPRRFKDIDLDKLRAGHSACNPAGARLLAQRIDELEVSAQDLRKLKDRLRRLLDEWKPDSYGCYEQDDEARAQMFGADDAREDCSEDLQYVLDALDKGTL